MSRAFAVVEDFEKALGEYTGAPAVVCTSSCTNAIFLSLLYYRIRWERDDGWRYGIKVPRHTYVGVPQSVLNAGLGVLWTDEEWQFAYRLEPSPIWDCAKYFCGAMYEKGKFHVQADPEWPGIQCVSFHIAKSLPLGHGGAILCDPDDVDVEWLRRARFDGRTAGETGENATRVTEPGFHMYMDPTEAARGLWLLEQFVGKRSGHSWYDYPDVSELMSDIA